MVRRNIKLPLLTALTALLLVTACEASSDADECEVGADCASGACADGVCVGGAGGQAGSGGVAGSAGSGGLAGSGGAAGAGGAPAGGTGGSTLCSPNHDGSIERAEVPLAAGLNAKFLTSGKTSISSAGELQADGSRIWDLSVALGGDHLVLAETQKLDGKWFAPKFPGATYASRLSESNQLLGVFEVTATALLLRGVVSPTDGAGRTELTYSPAVVALEFPLTAGKTWTTTTNVTGVASGVMAAYGESYESAVDAQGKLKAPFGEFPVLRTRVVLTRTVGVLKTVVRSYLFATECFGVVASIVAEDNEPNAEVSKAAEVRRLSP